LGLDASAAPRNFEPTTVVAKRHRGNYTYLEPVTTFRHHLSLISVGHNANGNFLFVLCFL
jgi:hypothetical protein